MQFEPQLDVESEVPLYRQLGLYLQNQMESGRLRRGDRLPPTRELALKTGLNRTTVSAAYDVLESEGLIKGEVGRGSFVTAMRSTRAESLNWSRALTASVSKGAGIPL